MVGLRFTRIKDSGYQEQGTTFQNLTIKKRQYNKVEGILGDEIKTTFYKDDFIIRPKPMRLLITTLVVKHQQSLQSLMVLTSHYQYKPLKLLKCYMI